MTDIKHDPDLPYAFVLEGDSRVYARFLYKDDANSFKGDMEDGTVIDTTPKPKIPEDADYLIWEFGGETTMAFRDGVEWFGNGCYWMSTEDLLEEIGDAEVTVLVRKEES